MTREAAIRVALSGRLGTPASWPALAPAGANLALDATFDVPAHGVTALFGPSGCGKTTILRCIAGLQRLPGRIAIGDEVWQDSAAGVMVPTHLRRVGYVFQEASLFPHLCVRDNLLYGARRIKAETAPHGLDLGAIIELLGIGHLLDRSPTTLSGGERQRVAVGRALLSGPRVLLMDEPLSALDRMTKEEILPYFETLHETLALPIIYVSHDLGEIERLADTLVLLDNGRVVASGPLAELQTDPRLPLIAAPDATVALEGRVCGIDAVYGLTRLSLPGAELLVPGIHGEVGAGLAGRSAASRDDVSPGRSAASRDDVSPGRSAASRDDVSPGRSAASRDATVRRLRIAASDVSLSRTAPTDSTILNCVPARIVSIDTLPGKPQVSVILTLGLNGEGSRIVARITRKSLETLGLAPGDAVFAQIKSVALVSSRAGKSAEKGGLAGAASEA